MQQPPHALVLIKEQLLTGHDSHYAGGIHLFSQLCRQLSGCSAFDVVHTLSTATKTLVLHHAITNELLHQLQTQTTSCGTEVISWKQDDRIHHHVIVRQPSAAADPAASGLNSLGGSSTARAAAAAVLSALGDILQELAAQGRAGSVILDTDTLQHASVPVLWPPGSLPTVHHAAAADGSCSSNSHTQAINPLPESTHHAGCSTPQQAPRQLQQDVEQERGTDVPFMLALSLQLQACLQAQLTEQPQQLITHPHTPVQLQSAQEPSNGSVRQLRPTWTLLALVQNIHHLPFGPCGTAPRSAGVLQGWRAVAGVICVSEFVRSYLSQHAVPLLPQLQPSHLHVTHPAAFGVWGPGPFVDLGTAAAARLWGGVERPAAHAAERCLSRASCNEGTGAAPAGVGQGDSFSDVISDARKAEPGSKSAGGNLNPAAGSLPQQQPQWQQPPVVGMLKMTREKGSALFLALARQLPALQFLAVCADPSVQQEVSHSAGLGNVQLLDPADDVSSILQRMSLVLVPNVLQEAFGMVVQDAMLHGVPVIVAAAGALPEAAAGAAAAVLPLRLVEFPPAAAGATSSPPLQAAECRSGENTQQLAQPAQAAGLSPCCCHKATCDDCWLMDQRKWDSRVYPDLQQHEIDPWASAIKQVLSSRECFQRASKLSRTAALKVVQQGTQHLDAVVQQLLQTLSG